MSAPLDPPELLGRIGRRVQAFAVVQGDDGVAIAVNDEDGDMLDMGNGVNGAVFIRHKRVIKAGCLLPFAPTGSGLEALGLGTRHQAALRLSQVSDALVIVVSEEKGWISLSLRGKLFPNIGTSALLQKLGKP